MFRTEAITTELTTEFSECTDIVSSVRITFMKVKHKAIMDFCEAIHNELLFISFEIEIEQPLRNLTCFIYCGNIDIDFLFSFYLI